MGGLCPDKGLGVGVVVRDVVVDGGGELGHTFEDTATNTLGGYFSEPTFDKIEPRRRGGNKMEVKARMPGKPYKENFGENFGDIRRQGVFYLPPDAQQRYAASRLRDQGADAVCLGISPVPRCGSKFLDRDRDSVDRIATKDCLYEIIIDGIPIPDENVAWQDILSFRAEQTSKELLRELRLWISETAKGELTYADAADRIEDLKEKYKSTLKRARMRFALSVARILVVGTAENLIKLEPEALLDTPFRILDARAERLDMEREAPGRELRYLVHVENSFPPH